MRKKYICLIALILIGCSDGGKENVDSLLETVKQVEPELDTNSDWNGQNYYNKNYGESSEGFYYFDFDDRMYYLDKKTGKSLVMCTKLDCNHVIFENNDRHYDCEAMYANKHNVQVYNGKLYGDAQPKDEEVQSLIVSNLDGTDKKAIINDINERIYKEEDKLNSNGVYDIVSNMTWRINDDIVYVFSHIGAYGGERNYFYIDTYDLKTGKYKEELLNRTIEGTQGSTRYIDIQENKLLLTISVKQRSEEQATVYRNKNLYMEIDLSKGNVTDIDVPDNGTDDLFDGKVVYQPDYDNVYEIGVDTDAHVCIELNEFEKKYGVVTSAIGEYLFVTPFFMAAENEEIDFYYTKVYDKDYKLIETIVMPIDMLPKAGHDMILFQARNDDAYYIADGSQIGTGNVEVKKCIVQ